MAVQNIAVYKNDSIFLRPEPLAIFSPPKSPPTSLKPQKKTGNCEENRSFIECGVILAKIFIFGSWIIFLFKNCPYYKPP